MTYAVILKVLPGYGEVLEQVNERDIHRGQMEILLEQEMVDEYVRYIIS